jgi:hypothetical protein
MFNHQPPCKGVSTPFLFAGRLRVEQRKEREMVLASGEYGSPLLWLFVGFMLIGAVIRILITRATKKNR